MATSVTSTTETTTVYGGFNCTVDNDCLFVACSGDPGLDQATCDSGVCTCSTRARFFIGVGVYIAALLAIAVYARSESRRTAMPQSDRLRDHFMASSTFGTAVMVLSIFSTAFSGYTVVGVPQEASRIGFPALRWLTTGIFVNIGALIVYPRLRQIGIARKYNSPTDLVGDRFNSNSLRLVTSVTLLIPLFIYCTVQFVSLADIIEGLSLGRINRHTASWILCAVIVLCEILGGQRSVTITDTVQAAIMIAAFLIMPFVLVNLYGGLPNIVATNCSRTYVNQDGALAGCAAYTRPWVSMQLTVTGKCQTDQLTTDPNCLASQYPPNATLPSMQPWLGSQKLDPDTAPDFQHVTWSMMMFQFNSLAFGLNPHFLQKVFVAKSDKVLKHSLMLLMLAALLTVLPSLYYGIVRVAAMQRASGDAFTVVTGELIDRGGFPELVAVVASCSALAAIMSTADSTIIGANNLITVEWVKNFLWRRASPKQLGLASKVTTAAFAVGALLLSFNVDKLPFAVLFNLQNSFVWQAVPTFYVALYSDRVAAPALLAGQVVGLVVCLAIAVSQQGDFVVPAGFIGVAVNAAVLLGAQKALEGIQSPLRSDDERKADRMDPRVLAGYGAGRLTAAHVARHLMKGTDEPLCNRKNQVLVLGAMVIITLGLPWYNDPYTQQQIYSGLPAWALGFFFAWLISVGIIMYVYSTWVCGERGSESPPRLVRGESDESLEIH